MKTDIQLVDRGQGPQLPNSRITVMDVFYYLHRGHGWDRVHEAMPSVSREEFDVIVDYINQHKDELAEEDRQVEERIRREIAEQEAMGLRPKIDKSIPFEERVERMKAKVRQRLQQQAEKNGGLAPR